jgi:hypothetical protein
MWSEVCPREMGSYKTLLASFSGAMEDNADLFRNSENSHEETKPAALKRDE